MAGILAGWVMLFQSWAWWIVLPMLGLFLLSLVDDVRNLSPRTRLVGHVVAALIVVGFLVFRAYPGCGFAGTALYRVDDQPL